MLRHLCVTALFAVVLIPDWAAACWPRWGGLAYETTYYEPTYYAPAYYAPPAYCQPVYVLPCVPVQPPRVEAPKPAGGSSRVAPPKPPEVRPAANVEAPKIEVAEPKRSGLIDIPKNLTPDATLPPLKADAAPTLPPLKADAAPTLPPLSPPKADAPKLPVLEFPAVPPPTAVPVPAPPSDALIPPANVPMSRTPDALPPLTLPPDAPVAPPTVEAKSSPLKAAARELNVSVYPAAGTATASGLRKVGFYNHTPRDLALTIEGKAVTLPAMSYLHAQLPPAFTWKCAGRAAATATVPADAAGVDVLIRE